MLTTKLKYALRTALTLIAAGATGYAAGDIPAAIAAVASAGAGLIQKNPSDPRLGEAAESEE